MKKFLSLLLVVLMVGTLAISSSAIRLSPNTVIQPSGTPAPDPTVPGAIDPQKLPGGPEGVKVVFGVFDKDGNQVDTIVATVYNISALDPADPMRKSVEEAMKDPSGLPGANANSQIVYAILFDLDGQDPTKSFFPPEGGYLACTMTFAPLNNQAINPQFFVYNSKTGAYDPADESNRVGTSNDFDLKLPHACPLLVTIDGYESYYSRFVGKKVVSPDTLEAGMSTNSMTVVAAALLGSACGMVAKKKERI